MTRAVIVDDEPLSRQRIRTLLAGHPEIAMAGEYGSGREALQALREAPVDLLFLDIEMPGMDGFDLLEALAPTTPRVIFVTAHEEYALRAFEVHALDYLLKPVDDDRFHEALRHALARQIPSRQDLDAALRALRAAEPLRHLVVPEKGRLRVVPVEDIESIEAEEKYVRVHSCHGAHLLRRAIGDLENALDIRVFLRIHRCTIVNVRAIEALVPSLSGNYSVVLKSGRRVSVSRRLRPRLRELGLPV
jgi:two-component system LytT family response regulator